MNGRARHEPLSGGAKWGDRSETGGTPTGPQRHYPARLAEDEYRAPRAATFVTMRARAGVCLTEGGCPEQVISSLHANARRCGIAVHAYCLMPGHLHAVCSIGPEGGDLALWVCRFKSGSTRRAATPLWQRSYWDRAARREEDVATMVEYVLANPVRRGLCESWQAWPWCWSEWHRPHALWRAS